MILMRRLAKAGPWVPWFPVAGLVGLILWSTTSLMESFESRQLYIRTALLVAALGISFVFDDPASETTDPTPSPLRTRRGWRTLLGTLPWATLVAATLLTAGQGLDLVFIHSPAVENPLPVGRLLLEAATMAAWGLAIAAVIAKRWDDEPGKFASAALLALYAASWMIPDQWKPWTTPPEQRWETALPYWWIAFALGIAIAMAFSWDARVDAGNTPSGSAHEYTRIHATSSMDRDSD